MINKIKDALNHIKPDDEQKKRMINNILENRQPKKIRLTKYMAIGVSVIVIISSLFIKTYVYRKDSTPNMANENSSLTIDKDLPKIRFSLSPGGMGYAGIMLFNREELISKNSWSEDINIDKLPVFKNDMPTDLLQLEDYFPREKKDELAERTAQTLGVDIIEYDEQCSYICDNHISISIWPDLSISIHWDKAVELPDINIEDEYEKQLYYLKYYYHLYENLFNFEEPEFEIMWAYSFSGEKKYDHYVFDKNGSNQEKILNYSFNKARFGIIDGMFVLHLPSVHQYEKIGDYPIISKKEAISNILKGKYLTTVPYDEDIDLEDIAKMELVYYISPYFEYLQPVYTAYIELENDRQENGLITYGIYYTPAIEEEYVDIIIDEVFFN